MKNKILGIFICTLLIIATVLPVAGNIEIGSISPLELIDTSVDTISPYIISSSPLIITVTGPSDLDEVTLYYRWSSDNISWEIGCIPISIFEDFESGGMNTSLWDVYSSTSYGQNEVHTINPYSGSFSWLMAVDTSEHYNLNELFTVYDFTGATNINIDFWQFDSTDEEEDAPDSWEDHVDADAVSFTNDGTTWYEIIDAMSLNYDSTWTNFVYNISSHSNFDPNITSSFAIKFQQYDNYEYPSDGRLWDDIHIYSTGPYGFNWSVWDDNSNPDTSYPWRWFFDFPNGAGYYEFYSIGKKTGETDEVAPLVADALCRFNRMPEIFDENPSNGSTGVQLVPQLDISISDADGETMNLNWYSNSSGTWQTFGTNSTVGDGTYSQINNDFNEYDTTYWWYVTVADDIYSISSPIFHFTTRGNYPPNTPSDPNPEDGESDVNINADLSWSGDDPDGDNVTFDVYFGTTSPPAKVVTKQSETFYDPGILDFDEEYFWQIVAWDSPGGLSTSGPIWSFTTEENLPPYTPSDPNPENGATDVSIEAVIRCTGGDPNSGDTVTYDVYFGKSSPPPLVSEDLSHPAYDPETMDLATTYYWQIVSEDSQGLTSDGPIWHFTTELEPNGPPSAPEIFGSERGPPGENLSWGFSSDDPDDNLVKYIIDWGDGSGDETDFYQDSTTVGVYHTYKEEGDYTIKAKAEDEKGLLSEESTFVVTITISRSSTVKSPLLLRLFDRFPNLFPILKYILGLL